MATSHAQVNLKPDSILEGKINFTQLNQTYAWCAKNHNAYTPEKLAIEQLKSYKKDLKFIVVIGTWCSDSREHVPAFYKIMDACGIGEKQIELIGTLKNKTSSTIDIAPLNIQYVPTFIVFYKNREIGRIIEDTQVSIEQDILNLITQNTNK